jgi:iron complex transport system substrate-binding protein
MKRLFLFFELISLILYQTNLFAEDFPIRIISLAPTLTEELYILGVGDRLIANTLYCERPPDAKKKEHVGTITGVNVEKVVSLRPDIVLVTSLTDARAKEKFKSLGIRMADFPYARSFQELCEQFLKLGEIVGRKELALSIIENARVRVGSIREEIKNLPRQKAFIQIGARPLYTANKDSFLNDFIELAGGENIAYDAKSGLYSREMVLKQDPDVIIITTMGIAGEEEKREWERFKTLKAVKDKRIHIIDSDRFCSPTPVSFVEGIEEIIKLLHRENE